MIPRLLPDCRDALRSLRAAPVVTAVAVLSLALGVGANTALFSVLNGLMLKPLPVKEPERLVFVDNPDAGPGTGITNPIWEAVRNRSGSIFDGAFAWGAERF